MNDKDKEAFEKWWMEGFKGMSEKVVIKYRDVGKQSYFNGWQAACEYKQKEIDGIKNELDYAAKILTDVQADKFKLRGEIEKLQAKNLMLKECVEFYSEILNWRDSGHDYGLGTIRPDDKEDLSEDDRVRLFAGKRARQVLKELDKQKGESK